MTTATLESKATMLRRFYGLMDQARYDEAADFFAPDAILHDPFPLPGQGREGIRLVIKMFATAFPGFQTSVEAIAAQDDLVAVLHTHRGTHTGDFLGIPPTGRDFVVEGLELFRIENDQVVEFWRHDDDLGLFIQLGIVPPPGQNGQTG